MKLVSLRLRKIFGVSSLSRMLDSSWKLVGDIQTLLTICFLVIIFGQRLVVLPLSKSMATVFCLTVITILLIIQNMVLIV